MKIEDIDKLSNANTLKKQFAFELFKRTTRTYRTHEAAFDIAVELARELYPHDPTPNAALYIANMWARDPLVIETVLQLENGAAEDAFLMTRGQFAMFTLTKLDEIDERIALLAPHSIVRRQAGELRRAFVEYCKLMPLAPEQRQ